ncbi:MAG TPA: lysophospholipid acyltransferase family protein [Stellaceae bacterium]|nr:lysophospholipid acyltransferase family protein [Stellaceae bacterium]
MTLLRSLLFNLAFYLWTGVLGIAALPLAVAPWRWAMALGTWWSGSVLWLARAIAGIDYELRGSEHLPAGAVIIAMKHQSAWDTLATSVLFRNPAIVAKRELFWIPGYGWYARRAGMIPVDRGAGAGALRKMVQHARRAVAQRRPIVIFPEGTRTALGTRRAYHPGVAALYSQLELPVVPVAVNSGLFWSRRSFLKHPGKIVVEALPPIPPGWERRRFLRELQERIEAATQRLVAEAMHARTSR